LPKSPELPKLKMQLLKVQRQMLNIVHAETPEQIATARELMMEYATRLGVDLLSGL
jgi:hypothetical protein